MIHLEPLGPNTTELTVGGTTVLFSYSTPVACLIPGRGYLRTIQKHSVTTSRHINKWLDGAQAFSQPQEFFDNLLQEDV